jgi:hypothetical protein
LTGAGKILTGAKMSSGAELLTGDVKAPNKA